MASIDREQVATDWAKRGFRCDLWNDPPGRRWEDFTHAADELVVVLDGEMEFEVAGQVCYPVIGEELLILLVPSTRHATSGRPLPAGSTATSDEVVTDHAEAGEDKSPRNGNGAALRLSSKR